MPKIQSKSAWLKEWIKRIGGTTVYTTDGKIIYCQACQQQAPSLKFNHLKQHNESAKHLTNVERFTRASGSNQKQHFLTDQITEPSDEFCTDLCNALVKANIPFFKLRNQEFKGFLEKYCKRAIPCERVVRISLKHCYDQALVRIKKKIGDSFCWVSVDESTDILGRYVANLIVGRLDPNCAFSPNLVAVKMLEKTNHSTMARFVNEGLRNLGIAEEKVLLLTTDCASYMLKAGRALNVFFPNLLHITCLCHALHRIAEEIRASCTHVDNLIANTKKVFTKAPSRVALYREMCPNLKLPPQPILTRWGTWINAAIFYCQNFQAVKSVVDKLDGLDAISIQKAKEAFADPAVVRQLNSGINHQIRSARIATSRFFGHLS